MSFIFEYTKCRYEDSTLEQSITKLTSLNKQNYYYYLILKTNFKKLNKIQNNLFSNPI